MTLGFGFGWVFEGSPGGGGASPAGAPRRVDTMLWINDTPLQRFGLSLERPSGWLDNVTRAPADVAMYPGLTGGRLATLQRVSPREITLTGVMLNLPLELQRQALTALEDALSGLLELRWPHAPKQVMRGKAGPLQVEPVNPQKAFTTPDRTALRVSVTITCPDGASYSRHPRRMRLDTTLRAVELGDLASGGEILLNGPFSGDCDVLLFTPAGVLLDVLALRDVELEDEDTHARILLDHPHAILKQTLDGTVTNVFAYRSLTDSSRWWKPSPATADRTRAQWPRLRLSSGAGWYTYPLGYVR